MLKRLCAVVSAAAVTAVVYSVLAGPVAASAASVRVAPHVRLTPKVAWVQAELPHMDGERVRIDVLTPAAGGRRTPWQWCDLEFKGTGTYRCGVDVSASSPAHGMDGRWVAELSVDGVLAGKVFFRTAARG